MAFTYLKVKSAKYLCLLPVSLSCSWSCYFGLVLKNVVLFTSLVFRFDALALSVIATATWLAGWVAGWLSHSGIVSKPLNLSENFFDRLKAPSL